MSDRAYAVAVAGPTDWIDCVAAPDADATPELRAAATAAAYFADHPERAAGVVVEVRTPDQAWQAWHVRLDGDDLALLPLHGVIHSAADIMAASETPA